MNISFFKKIIIFTIICLSIIGISLYISNEYDKKYTKIKPIETITNINCGEKLSLDQIYINHEGKLVKKENVKNYMTSENYKEYVGSTYIFKKNIKESSELIITDIEKYSK